MAHVTTFPTAVYAKSGVVGPDNVHLVNLKMPATAAEAKLVSVMVTHRAPTMSDPLWFDYTYPDGAAPMTETLNPGIDNAFVVMPGQTVELKSEFVINQVAVTATGAVPYAILAFW